MGSHKSASCTMLNARSLARVCSCLARTTSSAAALSIVQVLKSASRGIYCKLHMLLSDTLSDD